MDSIQDEIRVMKDFQETSARRYRTEVKELEAGSEVAEAAKVNYAEMAADIELWIAIAERKGRENRAARIIKLQDFRISQGVWGDG